MVCGYILLFLLDIKVIKVKIADRLADDHPYGKMALHLAVTCDVFGGVLFCAVRFPRRCLG